MISWSTRMSLSVVLPTLPHLLLRLPFLCLVLPTLPHLLLGPPFLCLATNFAHLLLRSHFSIGLSNAAQISSFKLDPHVSISAEESCFK